MQKDLRVRCIFFLSRSKNLISNKFSIVHFISAFIFIACYSFNIFSVAHRSAEYLTSTARKTMQVKIMKTRQQFSLMSILSGEQQVFKNRYCFWLWLWEVVQRQRDSCQKHPEVQSEIDGKSERGSSQRWVRVSPEWRHAVPGGWGAWLCWWFSERQDANRDVWVIKWLWCITKKK